MPATPCAALALDTVDVHRGPGSASSEQIPGTSPVLSSPFTPASDPGWQPDEGENDANARGSFSNGPESDAEDVGEGNEDQTCLHVVVVGGDVGAFATALALARTEGMRVTLVNAGIGFGIGSLGVLGGGRAVRGVLLGARTVSFLESLDGDEKAKSGTPEKVKLQGEQRENRWKRKGSIGERILGKGVYVDGYSLRRYEDGELLTRQEYILPSVDKESVAMLAINSDELLATLLDACLAHPHIDVRPRAVVRAVLPGEPSITTEYDSERPDEPLGAPLTTTPETKPENTDANANTSKRVGVGRRPGAGRHERRRIARESFIQLDDEELDPEHAFLTLPPFPLTPTIGDTALLSDILSAYETRPLEPDLFSSVDLMDDAPLAGDADSTSLLETPQAGAAAKTAGETRLRPAVVLTSGETLEADAVLGSEGPHSKLIEAVLATHPEVQAEMHGGPVVLREDGIYRAYVPISKLFTDPELRNLIGDDQGCAVDITTWIGPERFVTGYPVSKQLYYVSVSLKSPEVREALYADDDGEDLARRMKAEVTGWCTTVAKLVNLVELATYNSVCDYRQLEDWVSKSGRVAVLGDAAHPIPPYAQHGIASMIHDAITLGALFSKPLRHPAYYRADRAQLIPRLLSTFAAIRRPCCVRGQIVIRTGRDLFYLPDGEEQGRRDVMLRESGLLSDEEKRVEWLFDPLEAVEMWWAGEAGKRGGEGVKHQRGPLAW